MAFLRSNFGNLQSVEKIKSWTRDLSVS